MLLFATSLMLSPALAADAPAPAKKGPFAAFIALFAPPDEDGDGIHDGKDRCDVLPETMNGYADDDGCPDYLAALDVAAWVDGRLVTDGLTLTRGDGTPVSVVGPRVADDLVPGETVHVSVERDCMEAQGTLEVSSGVNRLDLHLAPSLTAGAWACGYDDAVAQGDPGML